MKQKIMDLPANIQQLKKENDINCRLSENVFYLNDGDILCLERSAGGGSRYPYEMDGLNLWAHSSGHINDAKAIWSFFALSPYRKSRVLVFG
ncbi:MAG: hypothetical protein HFI90_07370 [Clostridia bacterium]|nr:hypothetical protein [Clostridia bacterium]